MDFEHSANWPKLGDQTAQISIRMSTVSAETPQSLECRGSGGIEMHLRQLLVWTLALSPSLAFGAGNCIFASAPPSELAAATRMPPLPPRSLKVVLYPALPNFPDYKKWIVTEFEKRNPDIRLEVIDLTNNYYGPFVDDFVGCAQADVYELDSVFLYDFAINGKIQALPDSVKEPRDVFLGNAVKGVQVGGVQFGEPHWVCGNFFFFKTSDTNLRSLPSLDDLRLRIGKTPVPGGGIAVDLKGKSTLGEFYLNAAVDRYHDWNVVKEHIAAFDHDIEKDLIAIRDMCEESSCRDSSKHGTSFFAEEFDAKKARALIGYSESLNGALKWAADPTKCPVKDSCLHDEDIEVEELPLDPAGSRTMSWVDSFTIDSKCKATYLSDAAAFIHFMNEDNTYMSILLDRSGVPAYLLPAKASLYSKRELLTRAHLYPELRAIIENSVVPSDLGLNESLRNTGRVLDADLSKP